MYELPRKPAALPVASPRSCDVLLMKKLIADRPSLVGWCRALESRCRDIQVRVSRGYWSSDRERSIVARQVIAVLRAAHAHRDLDRTDIETLDRLQEYASGVPMAQVSGRAA
jgi:hypothetical protein